MSFNLLRRMMKERGMARLPAGNHRGVKVWARSLVPQSIKKMFTRRALHGGQRFVQSACRSLNAMKNQRNSSTTSSRFMNGESVRVADATTATGSTYSRIQSRTCGKFSSNLIGFYHLRAGLDSFHR